MAEALALPLTARSQSQLLRRLYQSAPAAARLHQSLRPYIASLSNILAAVPAGARVMDVGCGGGLFLLTLAASGRISAGFGFDASPQAVAAASAAKTSSGLDEIVHFEQRNIEAGVPDGQWPVVSMIDVMHHVPKRLQEALIRSLPQHVAPAGRLIIREPVRRPLWRNLANMLHDLVMARQLVHARDPEEVEGWLAGSGLKLVSKERTNALWYGYWLLVYDRP